jgi:hypothetical protein
MKQYAAYYVTSRRLDASTSARMVVRSLSSAFDRGYQVIENKDLGYLICDRTYSPGFIKPGLTVLKKKAEADSNGQLTADELFWVNEGEEFALMRRNPGGPATAVLDKKGGRVRVTPMDLVHTMGKSLAKAGYRCDLLFQEIDYARPLDDPKTLDGILDYAKKLDQENTANQKAEWTNKKWDLQTVTAALVKSGLGGHLLAALKEGGVKIKAGGKLKKNNVWVSYCDVDEKTIFILPEYDSATAADTLAEEGKHAVDGMMKKEEKNIIARLMNEWSSQDLYDIEFSGHLARIIMYQDMLAADANVAGRNWSGLRSNSTIEIKELEKGVFGEHIHQEYKDNESYDFSNNPVKIYEPFLDRCAGRTDNE